MSDREMILNLFMAPPGHHFAAWRLPDVALERLFDIGYYEELARIAERGKFDSIFLADGSALSESAPFHPLARFDPLLVLTALSRATSRIGLIATVSTTFNQPYDVARRFSSLDHISAGRAGWNIVTTWDDAAAANFGLDALPGHGARYARASEFVDVARLLWDSWDDDAIVNDKASGVFFDAKKVHRIDFQGEAFRVAGPLVSPRSPQGHPVLVQAGSSEDGKGFAARYADAVFTAQETLEGCLSFAEDVRTRAARVGRDPQTLRVLPGFSSLIGSTEAEAKALEQRIFEVGGLDYGLRMLSRILGRPEVLDMRVDRPLPDEILNGVDLTQGWESRARIVIEIARNEGLTVRQLVRRLDAGRGHRVFVGTPEQAADEMELWFRYGAADGFNVMPQHFPGGLEIFVDHVVPELQRRKLFREEYDGATLRDHYGLSRPEKRLLASGENP